VTDLGSGDATLGDVGLGPVKSWPILVVLVAVWLAGMLAFSPLADRIASRFIEAPPKLGAFRAIQESKAKLLIGIVIAWILGGFLEELVFRGIVLRTIDVWLSGSLGAVGGAGVAVMIAALGAGVIHLYQGPRAALIIVQLSILFGLLFVVSGYSLYSVVLCHGFYDTIAFIRFANKSSRYSKFAEAPASE
jgi:membrane protease YdiL (CAAX protease family)